jgi:hypothetical protein
MTDNIVYLCKAYKDWQSEHGLLFSPNPSTPMQTALITAAKASTITDQIDDITVPTKGAAAMVKSGSPATDFGLGG